MSKLANSISVSDFKKDAVKIMKRVRKFHETLIISQRGRAAAVLISVESYEQAEHEKELLRLLAKGEREIELGEGIDLDAVLMEADKLLTIHPQTNAFQNS